MEATIRMMLAACVLMMACVGVDATLPPTITYYVTVRDFMSAGCDKTLSSTIRDSECPNSATIKSAVVAGTLSGHPDFERRFAESVIANVGRYSAPYAGNKSFPLAVNNGILKPFVLSTLVYGTTGIGKMRFCKGEEGYQCDFNQTQRSVLNESSFSTWYEDDAKFNIRSAYKQPLFLQSNKQYSYQTSLNDIDNNNFYDPIKENNLTGWPLSTKETNLAKKKFWFTTEIHTSFQYRGNETFSFTGDDDVHVFINGRLAINIGGVHGAATLVLNVDDFAKELGLVKGTVYDFDLFHAERQTSDSNYGITTTLSEACNVVNSAARTNGADVDQAIDWTTSGRTNNSDWFVLAGPGFGLFDSTPGVKAINLMTPGFPQAVAYMYHSQQINAGSGFAMSFNFKVTGVGHGFSVIIHNRANGLRDLNGGVGPNLGFKNIDNSIAIAFDFCPEYPNTCNLQQIRMHYKRDGDRLNSPSNSTLKVFDPKVAQNWKDGLSHKVEIFYYSIPDTIEVYVDSSLRLVKKGLDVRDVIGGRNAFVGFAATSSDFTGMSVRIDSVQLTAIKVVDRFSSLADTEDISQPKTMVANGRDSLTFTLQTRDACSNLIQFGGLSNRVQGRLVSKTTGDTTPVQSNSGSGSRLLRESRPRTLQQEPIVLIPEIEDNNNGQYTLRFKTVDVADFSATLAFGTGCLLNGTQFVAVDRNCFVVNIEDAASSLPFITPAPTALQETTTLPTPAIIGVGVSGGVVCAMGSLIILVGVRVRNQWRKDKRFVEAGRLAALERDMKYEGDLELDALQSRLQKTIEELHFLRSRNNQDENKQDAIEKLLRDKGELQEIVRRMKAMKMGVDPEPYVDSPFSDFRHQIRKSFAAGRVSHRMSRAMSWRPGANFSLSRTRTESRVDSISEEAPKPFERLRMSVSRGFNRMYGNASGFIERPPGLPAPQEIVEPELVSTVNPLFLRMKQEQRSRQATLSTDSTGSNSLSRPSNSTRSDVPRIPPRPDASTVASITSKPGVPPPVAPRPNPNTWNPAGSAKSSAMRPAPAPIDNSI